MSIVDPVNLFVRTTVFFTAFTAAVALATGTAITVAASKLVMVLRIENAFSGQRANRSVWMKRRGYTSPGRAYVVMSGDDLVWLLKAAGYGPSTERAA